MLLFNQIPFDVVRYEILSFLPIDSLFRFFSTSKDNYEISTKTSELFFQHQKQFESYQSEMEPKILKAFYDMQASEEGFIVFISGKRRIELIYAKVEMHEMRTYVKPPKPILKVLRVLYTVFHDVNGEKATWEQCRKMIYKHQELISSCLKFDPSPAGEHSLCKWRCPRRFESFENQVRKLPTLEKVNKYSTAAGKLKEWITGVLLVTRCYNSQMEIVTKGELLRYRKYLDLWKERIEAK